MSRLRTAPRQRLLALLIGGLLGAALALLLDQVRGPMPSLPSSAAPDSAAATPRWSESGEPAVMPADWQRIQELGGAEFLARLGPWVVPALTRALSAAPNEPTARSLRVLLVQLVVTQRLREVREATGHRDVGEVDHPVEAGAADLLAALYRAARGSYEKSLLAQQFQRLDVRTRLQVWSSVPVLGTLDYGAREALAPPAAVAPRQVWCELVAPVARQQLGRGSAPGGPGPESVDVSFVVRWLVTADCDSERDPVLIAESFNEPDVVSAPLNAMEEILTATETDPDRRDRYLSALFGEAMTCEMRRRIVLLALRHPPEDFTEEPVDLPVRSITHGIMGARATDWAARCADTWCPSEALGRLDDNRSECLRLTGRAGPGAQDERSAASAVCRQRPVVMRECLEYLHRLAGVLAGAP